MKFKEIKFSDVTKFVLDVIQVTQESPVGKVSGLGAVGGLALIPALPYVGSVLLFSSLGVVGFDIYSRLGGNSKKNAQRTVVAVRHQSFEGTTKPLSSSKINVVAYEIDQTTWFQNGILSNPSAALDTQATAALKIKASLNSQANSELAYYGKAHIPLVMTLGYQLQGLPVLLYELGRDNGRWMAMSPDTEDEIQLDVLENIYGSAGTAVIRVSISFNVGDEDVYQIIAQPCHDIHIKIPHPEIDSIKNRIQVDQIAKAFRQALDKLSSLPIAPSEIHVFCAAPMSVVFAMGRAISGTIHPPTTIYNHSRNATPRYSWGIRITGNGQPHVITTSPI